MEIIKRLNKIKGQIFGIENMIKEKRSCDEILQQILAVKKAIDSLAKELAVSYIIKMPYKDKNKIESLFKKLIKL